MNGTELLAAYRRNRSEDSFSELVRRYSGLIYSVAKRRLSNELLAEEVVQIVFIRLAKGTPKVKNDAELAAWLHRTTVHVAIDAWRSETRRRTREQHAAVMEPASDETAALWEELAPQLDETLNQLNDADRQAVLLRFFQQKSMRDVGAALGISEDAAKMRISRALERLRTQLAVRAVACSSVALSSFMAERSVEAAPVHLVAALTSSRFLMSNGIIGAATALTPFALVSLMSKAKLATVLIAVAIVGIGLIGFNRAMKFGPASSETVLPVVEQISKPSSPTGPRPRLRRATPNNLAGALSNPDIRELDDAKRELRELLQKPPPGKGYPPPELRRVLARFGAANISEAMPILLEACAVSDYETRAWAVSGLASAIEIKRQASGTDDRYRELFALARPVFSKILGSPNEPQMLKLISLTAYFPPSIQNNGFESSTPAFDVESTEDLLAAMRVTGKRSDGFGFMVADHLARYFARHPDEVAEFAARLSPLLQDANPHQRLLAAYALASWPCQKRPEVKSELLGEIRSGNSDHSYRAASGLGKLGADAVDTIPDLLAFAERKKTWTAGYAESALEAACRLNPALRSQYPAIDAKLKQDEEAFSKPPAQAIDLDQMAAKLADPQEGRALQESYIASIQASSEPDKTRESILAFLEQTLLHASSNQRTAIQSVAAAIRQAVTSDKSEEAKRASLPIVSLLVDGRVMLVQDGQNPNETELVRALEEFRQRDTSASVTPERFEALAKALREIDPEFQAAWRKQVMKIYPWLDRVLQHEEP